MDTRVKPAHDESDQPLRRFARMNVIADTSMIVVEGIGVEVIAAGLKVLEVLAVRDGGFRLAVEHFPWASDYYLKHGYYIPEGVPHRYYNAGSSAARLLFGVAPSYLPS